MRWSVRRLSETGVALAGVLGWSLAGGLAAQDAVYAQERPMPIEVPTPDEGPGPIGEDEDPPTTHEPPPETAPAPAPAPEPEPEAEPDPEPPAEEPPPAEVQASSDQGAGAAGPARPSRGGSSSPLLQSVVNPGAGGEPLGEAEVLAPMVAAPGVSVAPPASEPAEDTSTDTSAGQDLAASPISAMRGPGEEPGMPSVAILTALAVGLAWYERRHRARLPRP